MFRFVQLHIKSSSLGAEDKVKKTDLNPVLHLQRAIWPDTLQDDFSEERVAGGAEDGEGTRGRYGGRFSPLIVNSIYKGDG
jgi:hypothetical protein